MNIALCKCGVDMSVHPHQDLDQDFSIELPEGEHYLEAAGTKYRCEAFIETPEGTYLCPRPAYHNEEGVMCGPLTGEKLW